MLADRVANGTLDRLERLGRIMFNFGGPLLLLYFIALYSGWIPSPLLARAESIERVLVKHDAQVSGIVAQRTEETRLLTLALNRVADVLKMIDCGEIPDRALRERCLGR